MQTGPTHLNAQTNNESWVQALINLSSRIIAMGNYNDFTHIHPKLSTTYDDSDMSSESDSSDSSDSSSDDIGISVSKRFFKLFCLIDSANFEKFENKLEDWFLNKANTEHCLALLMFALHKKETDNEEISTRDQQIFGERIDKRRENRDKILTTLKNSLNEVCLLVTAANDHIDTVKSILGLGYHIDVTDKSKNTPLIIAAYYGKDKAVELLLELGADIYAKDSLEKNALLNAAKNGRTSTIKLICAKHVQLEHNSDYLEVRSIEGYTPLILAAKSGKVEKVLTLVQLGANIEAEAMLPFKPDAKFKAALTTTEQGDANNDYIKVNLTAVMIAAITGKVHIVEKLLELGAKLKPDNFEIAYIYVRNTDCAYLLAIAARQSKIDVPAEFDLFNREDVKQYHQTKIHKTARLRYAHQFLSDPEVPQNRDPTFKDALDILFNPDLPLSVKCKILNYYTLPLVNDEAHQKEELDCFKIHYAPYLPIFLKSDKKKNEEPAPESNAKAEALLLENNKEVVEMIPENEEVAPQVPDMANEAVVVPVINIDAVEPEPEINNICNRLKCIVF